MFTEHQNAVIDADTGHLIVSAVAGSGKTTTVIGRIIRLIKSGVPPSRILVLMFGKSVSQDFVARMKIEGARHGISIPSVQTFHAFGMKLISAMEERGDLHPARLITKDFEVSKLVRAVIDGLNNDPEWQNQADSTPEFISDFVSMLEYIKSTSTVEEVVMQLNQPDPESPLSRFKPMMLEGFMRFERLRKSERVRTFSDLIFDPVTAIRENSKVSNYVKDRYDHILVDEFQDINRSQWRMLLAIAGTRAKITVVGDEDQAIFAWRGASSKFINEMQDTFENVQTMHLPHTFRFGHRLALAANHVISNNRDRMPKLCISAPSTPDTRIGVLMSDADSGQPAARTVLNWLSEGRLTVDIAVLVREYSHSLPVEAAFLKNNIPYCIVGAEPFFNRPEVLSLRGCLQLASGGLDSLDAARLRAVVNGMLRVPGLYLKNEHIEQLCDAAVLDPEHFLLVCMDFERKLSAASNPYRMKALRASMSAWESCVNSPKGLKASTFLQNIVRKLGLYEYFERSSVVGGMNERERMVRGLIHSAEIGNHTVESFSALLDDLVRRYDETNSDDCVLITSIHRAKGMEWPCVILPELSESNFPGASQREKLTEEDVGHERNLFYVAMTRAKEHLMMICPRDPILERWSAASVLTPPPLESIVASRFLFEGNFAASSAAGKAVFLNDAPVQESAVINQYISAIRGGI